jgi:RHH-type proline utilization regulon transcriptional repressor/proline dehydrogenase/delta 1-pyrroline-5-carboxylate dehydrogenase
VSIPAVEQDPDVLERDLRRVGAEIAASFPRPGRRPLEVVERKAMDLQASDAELRAALFRFVDVTPGCRGAEDLARHLCALLEEVEDRPAPLGAVIRLERSRGGRIALGRAAARGVRHMAHRFIVGETPDAALPLIGELWERGVSASVDLLGEATITHAEADRYAKRCHDALDQLARGAASWQPQERLERDSVGRLSRVNLSVKVSALTPLLRAVAPARAKRDAADHLRALLRHAGRVGAHLHVDMESVDSREAVLELVLELLAEDEFRAAPSAGLVLQAYLRDSGEMLDRVLDWIDDHPRAEPLVVRLVKGAYWDHEVVEARQHGWPVPVYEVKAESDRNFERLTRRLLDARPQVRVAIASHNLRSVAHAIAYNRLTGHDDGDIELQVLRGLGDDLQDALAARRFRVRTYCPVGDLVSGMAYLVRRLLENTSNESFLNEQARGAPLQELLAAP